MPEYKDMISQLKYPGTSRCMSKIYESTNMDYIHYSQDYPETERRRRQVSRNTYR